MCGASNGLPASVLILGFSTHCSIYFRLCDARLHAFPETFPDALPLQDDALFFFFRFE